MGKLIKHQWARLIVLTAGTCISLRFRVNSRSIMGCALGILLPKKLLRHVYTVYPIFHLAHDRIFNGFVTPIPFVQLFNLLAGLFILAIEWPLPFLKETPLHRAFVHRLVVYPLVSLVAIVQYQATNAAFYLLIGTAYDVFKKKANVGRMFKLGRREK